MTKVYYTLEPEFDDYLSIEAKPWMEFSMEDEPWMGDITDLAEKAAKDYYSEHDGWEASWPCHIWLWKEDATPIGCYLVTLEAVPTFRAWRSEE